MLSVNAVVAVPFLLMNFVRKDLSGDHREECQERRLMLCSSEPGSWAWASPRPSAFGVDSVFRSRCWLMVMLFLSTSRLG